MAKRKMGWGYSPGREPKPGVPESVKAEVETKAKELVEAVLKPRAVQPPPADAKYNYVSDITTKWHGRYFYFVAVYACPGPNAISPTFESGFARMEYAGGRFDLAFMRHTEKWHTLFTGRTLEECLDSIRDDPWFQPG